MHGLPGGRSRMSPTISAGCVPSGQAICHATPRASGGAWLHYGLTLLRLVIEVDEISRGFVAEPRLSPYG
jgi:hypothetical protein